MTRSPSRLRLLSALAVSLLAGGAAFPSRSHAEPVTAGGVDTAVGCSTADCIGSQTFELGAMAPVSGTIDVDPIGSTLDLDLFASSVSLVETLAGTEDNGVAEVEFGNLNYVATGLAVTEGPPGSFTIDFGQTASLDGDQTQWNDANVAVNGTPAALSDGDVAVTGNCFFVAPGSASCGLTFGTTGFEMSVGDPTPAPRHFEHSMSLVLPEPSQALLLASGMAGLLLIGRGRMRS